MDFVYDVEQEELLQVRVEEPRTSLPILIMMWEWRIQFLNALFVSTIELEPSPISGKRAKVLFWKHLAAHLLPLWRDANESSKEATMSKVSRISAASGNDFIPVLAPVHTWYLAQLHYWPSEAPTFSLLETEVIEQPLLDILNGCWQQTAALLERYHLDGYQTRQGSRANVPWIREVIGLTLDAWTSVPPTKEEWTYYLPHRVAAAVESGRNEESASTEYLCEETRSVLDLESTDTLKDLVGVKQFYALPDRIELELPKFFPFDLDMQWAGQVMDLVSCTVREHAAHRKKEARRCGAVVSKRKKRQGSHFALFAEYQVASKSYDQFSGSSAAAYKAVTTVSELIGLPLRSPARRKRPVHSS